MMDKSPAKEDPMLKMGIITGFLSQTKDRFHEYNKPLDLDQKFKLMTQIEGYDIPTRPATRRQPQKF
jgi:hypothetical protein